MPCARAERAKPLDPAGHAEQMMRDHAQRVGVQRSRELRVVEIERRRIDVAEDRPQSGLEHRRRHREAGVRRDDDVASLRTPRQLGLERHQRQRQRRRARRHEKDVADAEVSAESRPRGRGSTARRNAARRRRRATGRRSRAAPRPGGSVRPILMPALSAWATSTRAIERDDSSPGRRDGRCRGALASSRATGSDDRGPTGRWGWSWSRMRRSSQADMCLM